MDNRYLVELNAFFMKHKESGNERITVKMEDCDYIRKLRKDLTDKERRELFGCPELIKKGKKNSVKCGAMPMGKLIPCKHFKRRIYFQDIQICDTPATQLELNIEIFTPEDRKNFVKSYIKIVNDYDKQPDVAPEAGAFSEDEEELITKYEDYFPL